MANRKLLTVVNGKAVGADSNTLTVDFSSVKVGADALEIKQSGSGGSAVFDFSAKKLTNIAAGTTAGHAVEYSQLAGYIPTSQKGTASGVASLDSGGKIPATQLPNSVMEFKGTWDATNNVPVLADGGAAIAASKVIADLTYTALTAGADGNSISIQYVSGGTSGAETVTHVGTAFTVHMDPTPVTGSTATMIKAAIDADSGTGGAATFVSVSITGTAGNVQSVQGPTSLTGGQDAANIGDIYRASVAGTHNFGSGALTFAIGDWVMYSGAVWQKSQASDISVDVLGTVISTFSSTTGALSTSDTLIQAINKLNGNLGVTTGTANAALPSASFTDAAVTGKLLTGFTSGAGSVGSGDTILQGINKLDGNVNALTPLKTYTNDNAGTITIRQVVYVKSNGHVDLAVKTKSGLSDAALGLVASATILTTAPGSITIKHGERVDGFTSLTPGKLQFVSTAGALTETIPSTSGDCVYKVGRAISSTEISFEPEFWYTLE